MIKKLLLFLLISNVGFSQVVINELDADQVSTDVVEFVELKSTTSNFSLNGYVLVFFNGGSTGTGNVSYMAYDLDGITTDINGIATLGDSQVSPVPNRYFPNDNIIQNGPDAVGLYIGNGTDFPINTPATSTNLVDALVYHIGGTTTATTIMSAISETVSYNENANSLKDTQSIQRKTDGTYEVKSPTPQANNDGSGVLLNGISAIVSPTGELTEPSSFIITFSTQNPVAGSDLVFNYSLENGNFDSSDYTTGSLTVTIPIGSNFVVKNISIIDDIINEGDETMKMVLGIVPSNYSVLTNNVEVRIHDNDYLVKPWGTPLNPTYGLCTSTKPVGYYDSLDGLSGIALKQAVQNIIANPLVVREHTYADVFEMLLDTDVNPENDGQVWLMYVEQPRSKIDIQTGSSGVGKWNREHIYCQSRGNFLLDNLLPNDGINFWTATDANDITAGGADGHHIRAEDGPENSSRNNRNYGVDYNGPTGNAGSWHGDVARAVFYMAVRYNGLSVVNGNVSESPTGYIGDLATLLTWNVTDSSDDFEMNHNNVVYTWQQNRNPFVDHPDLADHIWGTKTTIPWYQTLSTQDFSELKIVLYPNPANNFIVIAGLTNEAKVEISTISGMKIYEGNYRNDDKLNLNLASGMYLVKVIEENKSVIKKLIIK
jgi:hypothetical protein